MANIITTIRRPGLSLELIDGLKKLKSIKKLIRSAATFVLGRFSKLSEMMFSYSLTYKFLTMFEN